MALSRARPGLFAGVCALALVLSPIIATPALAVTDCASPPQVMPTSQLTPGMTGQGVTTIKGTTPTPFDVEVLGVMKDYIWLGVDAIVVRITGPQSFLDTTGGVFYGMSGSPVSVNGQLIGSVSYGVSYDPTIVGLTPAAAMVDLFGQQSPSAAPQMPQHIAFDRAIRLNIAEATGDAPSAVTGGMQLLPTYVSASGLSASRLAQLQGMLDDHASGMQAVAGSSMPANLPVSSQPFTAGQPIGSVLSWGDFTVWAAGTVAVVCGDELVAYGHSLFYYPPGALEIGMTGATVLAVGNGHGLYPGDMVPVLTEPRGTFRRDAFAGEAGFVGEAPPSTPITSSITSLDTGKTRDGETDSIFGDDYWLDYQVWGHHVLNFGAVQQSMGPGTSRLAYTVEGTHNGSPFSISNRTMIASPYDATESVYKLTSAVDQLLYSGFGDVEITSVDSEGEITADQLIGTITNVKTSSSLNPAMKSRYVVHARPGSKVNVEVTMEMPDGGTTVAAMTVRAPRFGRGGIVKVRGGREDWYARSPGSFDDLVRVLSNGEHGNDLIVSGPGQKKVQQQPVVVDGRASFRIQVVR
jgi:SpoIVB peptidase S55